MRRTVIMGAAGRDFHNFNMVFRNDPSVQVVAFTAAQIPNIVDRRYPSALAGPRYPDGIAILPEDDLARIVREQRVDQVVFAYSDVAHTRVMDVSSIVLAAGADFVLLGPTRTMIKATVPVIAICAVRTGCGKSQVARWIASRLKLAGARVAVLRHPMPYGDLAHQAVQRFACLADLDAAECTVEEREEYEPHLRAGHLVYAGVDYEAIVTQAQDEADVLLWDGGNNDFPFLDPDLHLVLMDALRPGDEVRYHPGEAVLRMADVVVINKANSATQATVRKLMDTAAELAPGAPVVRTASPVKLQHPEMVRGKRVLVIEDGPTITHGGMSYGAGYVAAVEAGAAELLDPRAAVSGELADLFNDYPHIGTVLPALGYGDGQLADLAATITRVEPDVVVSATPCDLQSLISIPIPVVRASYEFCEIDDPGLGAHIDAFVDAHRLGKISAT